MTKVFVLNTKTGAATTVKPNAIGEVSWPAWQAALRRIKLTNVQHLDAECRHEFICSANSGKVLAVRFPACAR